MAGKLVPVVVAALAALAAVAGAQAATSKQRSASIADRSGRPSASCPSPGTSASATRSRTRTRATRSRLRRHLRRRAGTPGTNVLTINKDLTLRGAGADQVTVEPAERRQPDRRGRARPPQRQGAIIAVIGKKTDPSRERLRHHLRRERRRRDRGHRLHRREGLAEPLPRDRSRHRREPERLHRPGRLPQQPLRLRRRSSRAHADASASRSRAGAHGDDRPHADRALQLGRHPDRRRDRRLLAVASVAARRLRRILIRGDADRRRDRRPQLVPPLQRLHGGRPDRPGPRPADRRRLPAFRQRRDGRPSAAADPRRPAVRPGRRAGHAGRLGAR